MKVGFDNSVGKQSARATEVQDIVRSIPQFRDIFHSKYEGDLFSTRDYSEGVLYLSRYNVEDHHPETGDSKRKNSTKSADDVKYLQDIQSESGGSASFNKEKKRRFAMSLATLASKPDKRESMVNDGAIQALTKLSIIDDTPIHQYCAAAFSLLASEPKVRQQMIAQDAFKAIIVLSSVSNDAVKIDCCRALCNLCCEENGHAEQRAVRENTPNTIIQIAQAVPSTLENCLKTLLNLSCVTEKYTKVDDVIDALMHFSLPTFHLSEIEEILLISAMCNLSAVKNNHLRLVEHHCLRVLDKTVKSPNPKLRILSSEVVRNLTTDIRTRGKVVDQNVVSTLVGMSKDELEHVKTACAHAFHNLSRDSNCREKIVLGGAVAVVIRMSMDRKNTVEMDRTAARTLRVLCGDRSLAQRLVRDGIVKALMSLIRTDDSVIWQYCAESICSLFKNEVVLAKLIDQGAVGVLVSLCVNNTDEITGDWCAFALYALTSNKLCPPSMLANGILPCLIKLCESSTVKTRQFCGAALRIITQQKTIEASSAIPILVYMLRNETDQVVKTNCASALYNLAESDAHCDKMLSAGALMPVVRLTQSDYMETKIKCAAILSRLSLHEQYYEQFGRDDVLKVLLDLSCVEHTLTQQRVVIAMSNLTQFQSLRLIFNALHACKFVLALSSKPDEQIRRGCAAIICNLSYDYGGERVMVNNKVLSTLLITALVTSDQVETKIICIKALVNLQCDRTLYKDMVKEGLIWGISTLAMLDDSVVLTLCAKALCNLSSDFAAEMLKSSVAIKAITKLLSQNNLDMQKDGGRALMNLLLQSKDSDEKFRLQAVSAVELMASSQDEELTEMCVICLCYASQSDACRTSIIKLRRLRMINASTIFTKPLVSKAYLTMFGNIANNASMRTQLLDEQSMERFMHICNAEDPDLDLAVAKAIYSVSCAEENIPILAQQKTIAIISTIFDANYPKSKELLQHLVACLYNMTTSKSSQGALVSQGIVALFIRFWPQTKDDFHTCNLICKAVSQLGCGSVNTAKMVEDGCAQVLCFVTQHRYQHKYKHYRFPVELRDRCAAALRSILRLIPNQAPVVQAGAIKTLMDIARPPDESLPLPALPTQLACASALRSISYNSELRGLLVATDAIGTILSDHEVETDTDLEMNGNLLRELEAESWSNGSRGIQKERKVPELDPLPMDTSLLCGTSQVDLPVPKSYSVLQKYLVYVYLEEPPLETEDENIPSLSLDLKSLDQPKEDDRLDRPLMTPKQPAEMPYETFHIRSLVEQIDDVDEVSSNLASFMLEADLESNTTSVSPLKKESSKRTSPPTIMTSSMDLPPISSHKGLSGTAQSRTELPALPTPPGSISSSSTRKKSQKVRKDENFKGLVALIKHSKATGGDVDSVVNKWSAMTKF